MVDADDPTLESLAPPRLAGGGLQATRRVTDGGSTLSWYA